MLPGCVDMHTHMEAPHNDADSPGDAPVTCDDYRDGTIAAAVGGTTTIVDFATQAQGTTLTDTRVEWLTKLADRPPAVDVGLHMIVTSLDFDGADDDLAALCEEGITSYKLFLAYKESPLWVDDNTLFRVAQVALEPARSSWAIARMVVRSRCCNNRHSPAETLTRSGMPARVRRSQRPRRYTRFGTLCHLAGAPGYVMHVTCREAVEALTLARRSGMSIWGETCPQYRAFSEHVMSEGGLEAAK